MIIGGRLPTDLAGRRVGEPDMLVRTLGTPSYRAVDIKAHQTHDHARAGIEATYSALAAPCPGAAEARSGRWARKRRTDLLQLAHYQRVLEAAGFAAPGHRLGGIIGVEKEVVWHDLDAPVWLTPSHGTKDVVTTDGVTIVHGPQFRDWLGSILDERFAPEDVAAARAKLREHTGTRDKAVLERLGPPPQHPRDWLFDLGRGVFVAGAGLVAGLELVRATGPAWFLGVGAGLASLSWAASRLKLRRLWWFAWLTGTQAVTALFAVPYAAAWVLHLTH